jgi:hypothetical protein
VAGLSAGGKVTGQSDRCVSTRTLFRAPLPE